MHVLNRWRTLRRPAAPLETQISFALHCVLDVFVAAKSEQLHLRSQAAICKIVCLHHPRPSIIFEFWDSEDVQAVGSKEAVEAKRMKWTSYGFHQTRSSAGRQLLSRITTSWNPKIYFWMRETRLFIFVLSCLGCFWTARTWKAFYTSKPNMHGFCRTSKTSLSSNRIEHRSEWAEMGRKIEWPRSRQASPRHWQPL